MQGVIAAAISAVLILSMAGSLLSTLVILTIGFSKVRQVERYLDMPELSVARFIGDSMLGRLQRTANVVLLFTFRNIPKLGPHIVRQVGEEVEPVPLRLKLWVTLPMWALALSCLVIGLVPWLVADKI